MNQLPRITFGVIVLKGEPFTRYCLRSMYPFAHQIIVVEGAAPASAAISTADGHSRDGTLETLRRLKTEEDPDDKVTIVTAEDEGHPDGFWPGEKHEQSGAYARRATGEYLWQIDIDEFYHPQDVQRTLEALMNDPTITAVSFRQIQFWGGFDSYVDSRYLRRGGQVFHRLFKWAPGYTYSSHRPPTVLDEKGRDLRSIGWFDHRATNKHGISLYHYSLLFPKQVREKCAYYAAADWAQRTLAEQWAQEVFIELRRPYRVHNVYDSPGWLERFRGAHPPQIEAMRRDIESGRLDVELRPTDDIERLLRSPRYRLGVLWLKMCELSYRLQQRSRLLRAIRHPLLACRAISQLLAAS